jgi:hypothetical protein
VRVNGRTVRRALPKEANRRDVQLHTTGGSTGQLGTSEHRYDVGGRFVYPCHPVCEWRRMRDSSSGRLHHCVRPWPTPLRQEITASASDARLLQRAPAYTTASGHGSSRRTARRRHAGGEPASLGDFQRHLTTPTSSRPKSLPTPALASARLECSGCRSHLPPGRVYKGISTDDAGTGTGL